MILIMDMQVLMILLGKITYLRQLGKIGLVSRKFFRFINHLNIDSEQDDLLTTEYERSIIEVSKMKSMLVMMILSLIWEISKNLQMFNLVFHSILTFLLAYYD